MKRLLLVLLMTVGCHELTGSFGDVIAVEVSGSATRMVQEGDTLQLSARALGKNGDTIEADITWVVLDTAVGFSLDAATGLLTASTPGGPWRVVPRTGDLRGNILSISVTGAPDSVAAVGDTGVTAVGLTNSSPMTIHVYDLTTSPGSAIGLNGVSVTFRVLDPAGTGLALKPSGAADSTATADSTTVVSGGGGVASAVLRATGAAPDSAVVTASLTTATGGAVAGSPVRFVVRYQ